MKIGLRVLVGAAAVAGLWFLASGVAHAQAAEESCFTSKINGARAAAGRASLAVHSELVTIARRHSKRMADSGTIFHNSNLAKEAPDGWQSLGENVGMGPTCDAIHKAFMDSASHRANILDPDFNYVGVGVVIASDGTIFVTEVFMEKASQTAQTQPAPTTTTRPRTRTAAPKPAPPPPPPAPPPPPPPGSKVTGQLASYMDLQALRYELLPSPEEVAAYESYLTERARRRAELAEAESRAKSREHNLFSRIAAFMAGVLAGTL